MPKSIPLISPETIKRFNHMSLAQIAVILTHSLLGNDILLSTAFNFDAPLKPMGDNYVLELFHGPTLAFKDFGARFMAQLMIHYQKKSSQKMIILVATSGDTGSAVAAAFHKLPNIEVVILYPKGRVSPLQEVQLTGWGDNITAVSVTGSFDDCQKLVKQAFSDLSISSKIKLASANSINIARLLGQVFYYFRAYAQLPNKKLPVVISVPSGNFGNLTAGLIAKRMGLPVSHFIAATNANRVVPDYLQTGKFIARSSIATLSNSMDVGNPSNLARIQELYHGDLNQMCQDISSFSFSDRQTRAAMRKVYKQSGYFLDPHGAVAYLGLKTYLSHQSKINGVFLATAHPAKFKDIVEQTIHHPIKMPSQLGKFLHQPHQSLSMQPKYSQLKQLLVEKFG